MENYSRVGYQVKGKISRFCGKIDAGLSKPRQKFVQQMIHGMISRRSVLLTEVVRSLPQTASFIASANK